jgi:hypothetical protein
LTFPVAWATRLSALPSARGNAARLQHWWAGGDWMRGRDGEAGLGRLVQVVVVGACYAVAFLLGSLMMAAAPLALELVVLVWSVVQARLEGENGCRWSGIGCERARVREGVT